MSEDSFLQPSPKKRLSVGAITAIICALCVGLFLCAQAIPDQIEGRDRGIGSKAFFFYQSLLYDEPKKSILLAEYVAALEELGKKRSTSDNLRLRRLENEFQATPYWGGFYPLLLKKPLPPLLRVFWDAPKFEKISQGEIWRLFTPALLHFQLLHLGFNMLWLVVVGRAIEARLSSLQYVILILLIGMISNTAQYLMVGANFIGFSGVVCGMLGFVWARQRSAPWEGYAFSPDLFRGMLWFVVGVALCQVLSFFIERGFGIGVSLGIGNTAHLTGGIVGAICGQFSWFSSKVVVK